MQETSSKMDCKRSQAIKNRHASIVTAPLESMGDDENFEQLALANKIKFKLFISELLGTFIFVYLGQAGLASFELTGTQNDMFTRLLASISSQGLAYLFASLLTLSISGAYLNPAYTIASATFGKLKWGRAINHCLAQYLGAFLAAVFLHSTYFDKLNQRHLEGLLMGPNVTLRAHGNILSTGKLFTSYPPTEVSHGQLFVSYTFATAHFVLLLVTSHEAKLVRIPRSLRPFYLAAALCLILSAFSANGGPVLNPAQDFSPRLYIALFGWGSAAFNLYNFKYWWICGLVAPHLGALIGLTIYRLLDYLKGIREPGRLTSDQNNNHRYQLPNDYDF